MRFLLMKIFFDISVQRTPTAVELAGNFGL